MIQMAVGKEDRVGRVSVEEQPRHVRDHFLGNEFRGRLSPDRLRVEGFALGGDQRQAHVEDQPGPAGRYLDTIPADLL
jgi:hypothetical protein